MSSGWHVHPHRPWLPWASRLNGVGCGDEKCNLWVCLYIRAIFFQNPPKGQMATRVGVSGHDGRKCDNCDVHVGASIATTVARVSFEVCGVWRVLIRTRRCRSDVCARSARCFAVKNAAVRCCCRGLINPATSVWIVVIHFVPAIYITLSRGGCMATVWRDVDGAC